MRFVLPDLRFWYWFRSHNKRKWHLWFAWHPVKLMDRQEWVWLENIERMKFFYESYPDTYWWWYREAKITHDPFKEHGQSSQA